MILADWGIMDISILKGKKNNAVSDAKIGFVTCSRSSVTNYGIRKYENNLYYRETLENMLM